MSHQAEAKEEFLGAPHPIDVAEGKPALSFRDLALASGATGIIAMSLAPSISEAQSLPTQDSNPVSLRQAKANISTSTNTSTPKTLSDRANNLIVQTTQSWLKHQKPDGSFIDPVRKGVKTYGAPMIGQSMIQVGVSTGNNNLISSGIRSELSQISRPDNDGFNVGFEVFGMADSLAWNNENLSGNPDWESAKDDIAEFLRERSKFEVGDSKDGGVRKCFEDSSCYYNLKLVKALAGLELNKAGVSAEARSSSAGTSRPEASVNSILNQAKRNFSDDASYSGKTASFREAGLLSDPPKNPTAYAAFSSMILGRIIKEKGVENTDPSIVKMFEQTAKGVLGLMSPSGDVSYIGRGQGQVWTSAASANALSIAADITKSPAWRARYLAGVDRSMGRLENMHKPGNWGMPVVPRLSTDRNPDYKGIDRYATTVGYNGLALDALRDAIDSLKNMDQDTPYKLTVPIDKNGVFTDPSSAKFSSVKKGSRWWAIHGSATHVDARYDFGVVAAEKINPKNGKWESSIPNRPYTHAASPAGPTFLDSKGHQLLPKGNSISSSSDGSVLVKGGWSKTPDGKILAGNRTNWTFKPTEKGVSMSFISPKSRSYKFRVWFDKGSKLRKTKRGLTVLDKEGRKVKYSLNNTIKTQKGGSFSSAYKENLGSVIVSTKAKAGKRVKYSIDF